MSERANMAQVTCPSPFAAFSRKPILRCRSACNNAELQECLALRDEYAIITTLHKRLKCFRNPWMRSTGQAACSATLECLLLNLPSPQQLPVQDLPSLAQVHLTMSAALVPLLDSILGVKLPSARLPDDVLAAVVARLEVQSTGAGVWSAVQNTASLQMFHLRRARQLTDAYKQLSFQQQISRQKCLTGCAHAK